MQKSLTITVLVLAFGLFASSDAATIKQTMEGSMDVTITYPDSVISGREFSISFLLQNNGWEDKQDIIITTTTQSDSIVTKNGTISADRLSKDGSFGGTMEFVSLPQTPSGTYYLNAVYSQVLLSNNETPNPPTQKNIAIPIQIKTQPQIQLNTVTPSSIFANAEFPFDIEIISKDIDLRDVTVEVKAPEDISFRGQTTHTFSLIQKDEPIFVHAQIVTSQTEVAVEHKLPFEVRVKYTDDLGEEKTMSKTVPLLLRPRTFMEITTDGGVWIGGFFLAPYVSIGTIVGIPAGTLFSIALHRLLKKKNIKKGKTK